jgi:hypothetical protein
MADYGVSKGNKVVVRFTYPNDSVSPENSWLKSPGILIASACKAVLGDGPPFAWPNSPWSAYRIACTIDGEWGIIVQGKLYLTTSEPPTERDT